MNAKEQLPPATKKKPPKETKDDVFEFCEVCRLNHSQGRRHKYSSSHVRSLSSLLSRFQEKLANLRSSLQNPKLPLQSDHFRFNWCVLCGIEVLDVGGSIACGEVINHLASVEHLRNARSFLKKHGGSMDRVDLFRVSDDDLLKREKGCKLLKSAASTSSEGAIGAVLSKDIQHELISKNMDSFDNHSFSSFNSNASHSVMPLQSITNDGYRAYHHEINSTPGAGPISSTAAALSVGLQGNMGPQDKHAMGSSAISLTGKQPMQLGSNRKILSGQSLPKGVGGIGVGEAFTRVLQKFTQISCAAEGSQANVHSQVLPPWLDASEEQEINSANTGSFLNKPKISSAHKGKSTRKLNPKRVGAAWAERRIVELEMEMRGEKIPNAADANWLPNFGRVWQTGTRKESRKEFEMEKQKFLKDDNQHELSFKMQLYISKRMRIGSPNKDSAVSGLVEDIARTL